MDCTKMTDADLNAVYSDASAELSRRAQFRAIPGQVAALTTQYIADGGQRADVKAAVDKAPEPPAKTDAPPPAPASGSSSSGTTGSSGGTGATVGVTVGTGR